MYFYLLNLYNTLWPAADNDPKRAALYNFLIKIHKFKLKQIVLNLYS